MKPELDFQGKTDHFDLVFQSKQELKMPRLIQFHDNLLPAACQPGW
jgi:hypothetical protein